MPANLKISMHDTADAKEFLHVSLRGSVAAEAD